MLSDNCADHKLPSVNYAKESNKIIDLQWTCCGMNSGFSFMKNTSQDCDLF
ncbi:hypothetical protein VINE108521_03800 [Vibrio neonatus]